MVRENSQWEASPFSFEILTQFEKIGENTFQQAWQSLKFVCSKFRTKLNLPPVQVLFCAGKTPLACSKGKRRKAL
jgi:hypothetical protein